MTFSGGKEFFINPDQGQDIYIRDRNLQKTVQISRSSVGIDGDQNSDHAAVSGDGSVVVYESRSTNLVESGGTNSYHDIYATEITLDPPDQNAPTWPDGSEITVSNLGATLADLSWSPAEDDEDNLTGYRVYLDGHLEKTTSVGGRESSLTGLSQETTYTVKVEAYDNSGNESTDGPGVEITTKAIVIGGAGLTGPALEGGQVGLTSDPAEGNVERYFIERKIVEEPDWIEVGQTNGNLTIYSDRGLPASTDIAYRIRVQFKGETEKNLHSKVLEVKTPDLFLDQIEVTLQSSANSTLALAKDGLIEMRLHGERDRIAQVAITYTEWPEVVNGDTIPVQKEATVELIEDGSGQITRPDGSPVARAVVKAVGVGVEIDAVEETTADSDGRYTIERAYGITEVQAIVDPGSQFSESVTAEVEVPSGGEITLDLELKERQKIKVRIRGIEFVDATGRSQRYLDIRNLPTRDRVSAWINLPGVLTPLEQVTGSADGLEMTISLPRESPYTLTVEAPEMGYEPTVIEMTAGEDRVVEIPMVTLFMDATRYLVADLQTASGVPLDPSTIWAVGSYKVPEGFGGFLYHYFFGIGPRFVLPNVPQGSTELVIYDGAYNYPDQKETFSTVVQTVILDGENNLGTIRMDSPGLLANGLRTYITSHPKTPVNGDRIRVEIQLSNSTTEIEDIEIELVAHPSLAVVQESVYLEHPGLGEDVVVPSDTGFRIGDLKPERTAHFSVDLQIDPENEQESLDFQIRASYRTTGELIEESIGGGRIEVVFRPTLNGPESIPARSINLSGRSPVGKIRVLDEDEIIAETRVSEYGYWRVETELADRRTPYWHQLTAVHIGVDGEQQRSDPLWVLRHPLTPRPVRVSFRQPIEEANTAEEKELFQRFPDVGELTEFEVPSSGVAKFWTRILAGVPFDFAVEFNHPDAVKDVSVKVEGPAGGVARATQSEDDGLFRARVQPRRDVRWIAGKISIQYTPLGGTDFPKWANDIIFGDEVTILDEDGALPASTDARSSAIAGTDFGVGRNYSLGGGLEAQIEARFRANQPVPQQGSSIQYPFGSIGSGSSSSSVLNGNVDWSISGPNFSITVELTMAAQRFVDRDRDAPVFPEGSTLRVLDATDSQLTLNWDRAIDNTWIDAYTVWLNGEQVTKVEGDQFEATISNLVIGKNYDLAVEGRDAADHVTAVRLTKAILFEGAATNTENPVVPIAADQKGPIHLEVVRPTAGVAGKAVKIILKNYGNTVSNSTTALDVVDWYKGIDGSEDKYDRWDSMVDNIDSCGSSPADLGNLKQQIKEATEADIISNIASTTFTAASIGLAFTGAGLPAGLALEVSGLATGAILGSIADKEAAQVEEAFAEAVANSEECEEEPECPPNTDCDPPDPNPTDRDAADPTWKIDPSGYVYEITEDNRLEEVTATLFEGESENGPWVVSAAEEFGGNQSPDHFRRWKLSLGCSGRLVAGHVS